MPRISEFYGIAISMYYDDHPEPHFHARYAEFKAKIAIKSLEILDGGLPLGRFRKVKEWAELHKEELLDNWELADRNLPLKAIEPLS